jgi:hypothetical protein
VIKIPEISEEEYKKFKELLEAQKKREEEKKVKKELFLEELSARTQALIDLNKTYGPVEAYAVTFAKFIENDFKVNKTNVLWFNWEELQNYLTDVCLMTRWGTGVIDMKRSFRRNLKDRGICFKIDRKYNTVKVYKCQKRKTIVR